MSVEFFGIFRRYYRPNAKSLLRRRESHCLGFNFRWKQGDKRCAYNSEPWKKLGKTVASELSLACLLGRLVRFTTACLSVFVSFPLSASLSRRKACTQRPASFEDGLSDFASSLYRAGEGGEGSREKKGSLGRRAYYESSRYTPYFRKSSVHVQVKQLSRCLWKWLDRG